jgi:SAM-dependent methyltransferase
MNVTEIKEAAARDNEAWSATPWSVLEPLRAEISRPQAAFNDAVVRILSADTGRWDSTEAERIHSELLSLSDPTRWQLHSHRGQVVGRAVEVAKTAALRVAETGLRPELERQRRWNQALIRALLEWGRNDAKTPAFKAALDELTTLQSDASRSERHKGYRWPVFPLSAQANFNQQLLSFLKQPRPPATFRYDGYEIPEDLMTWTGGGARTWEPIGRAHMEAYVRYCPILPSHAVFEVGCGVGRDAMQLTKHLSGDGRYIGVDIMAVSIDWCARNITPRYSNFTFHHLDIRSSAYNPSGNFTASEVRFPADDGSVDRILLQSVFTHMFRKDIVHYLREFCRMLKPGGRVFASLFLTDPAALSRAVAEKRDITFPFEHEPGCRIRDRAQPELGVGYTPEALEQILKDGGMELDQPVHRGWWSGWPGALDGQDIAILKTR